MNCFTFTYNSTSLIILLSSYSVHNEFPAFHASQPLPSWTWYHNQTHIITCYFFLFVYESVEQHRSSNKSHLNYVSSVLRTKRFLLLTLLSLLSEDLSLAGLLPYVLERLFS